MPKLTNSVPKYRHHKRSGQAVVTLRGRDVYLGPYNSKGSKLEYDRVIAEWLAAGRPTKPVQESCEITVTELVLAYWKFAQSHYVKDGQPTGATAGIKVALRLLRQCYGPTPAVEFGPLALKAMQMKMIDLNQSRGYINSNIDRIRRMFKWAASEELIPASIPQALAMVPGLRKGRTAARDLPPVQPVPDSTVDATILHLPKTVADMVRFQRLTGCRPKEVCILRPIDVDTTAEIWRYQPESHKTEHHGRDRVIFIGPKAQAVLRPYLLRDKRDYCFSPAESERKRSVQRREHRQTPMTPSQRKRESKRQAQRTINPRYNKDSYRRAIQRACELAFGMPKELRVISKDQPEEKREQLKQLASEWRHENCWSPNQLRHSAATDIRKRFGLEGAQVTLGHASADVTQVYAERDLQKALEIMREVG